MNVRKHNPKLDHFVSIIQLAISYSVWIAFNEISFYFL